MTFFLTQYIETFLNLQVFILYSPSLSLWLLIPVSGQCGSVFVNLLFFFLIYP